jgi:phosphate transport system permease protein
MTPNRDDSAETGASPIGPPTVSQAASSEGTRGPLGLKSTARARRRRRFGAWFAALCGMSTLVVVVVLVTLLVDVAVDGWPMLDLGFITGHASRFPDRTGIRASLLGTFWLLGLTFVLAFPIAIGAAIYLEEYAPRNRVTHTIQVSIANLAGVPSIVYGILGLALFVGALGMGRSVIAAALTLSTLILPVVVLAAQEAIRGVPQSLRDGAYALGATQWQVVRHQVLPMALPGVVTGTILALSRVVGETAPMIMIGAFFVTFSPRSLADPITVLPLQIFHWVVNPQEDFRALAASAIVVLLVILLSLNATAVVIRNRARLRS